MTATAAPLQVVSPPEESRPADPPPTATAVSLAVEESMRLAVTEDTFTPHDVVLGKGNGINSLPGNLRFRRIIWKYKPLYASTPRSLKGTVAELVINEIACLDPPGRFLEPQSEHRCFRQVPRKRAIEKTCQALREKKNNMGQRQVSPDQERLQQLGGESSTSPSAEAKKENEATTLTTSDKEPKAEGIAMETEATVNKTEVSLDTNKNKGPRKADPIMTIIENDVLYGGRGRRHFHRIANQRFLEMIKTSRAEYHESRCKKTVAKRIVHDWKSQDPPGRFLQQESNTEKWFEIKPSKIMEKTCQALRDLKRERGPAGVKQGISERMIDPWEKSMPFAMTGQPMPMNNNGHMPPQPGQMHPHGQQGHAPFHPQQGQPWMGGNPMFPQGGMTGGMMASHPSMGQVPYQMPQPQQQPAQTSQPMEQPAPQSTPDDTPMAEKKEEEKKDESTEDNTKTAEASNEAINKTETKDNKEAAASDKVETNDKQATTEEANATEDAPVGEEVHAKELTEASEDKAGNDKGDKTAEDKRKNGELEAAALLANMFR